MFFINVSIIPEGKWRLNADELIESWEFMLFAQRNM